MNSINYFDDLNMAVMTTKFVFSQGSQILTVSHYDDGWWEFVGKEANLKDDDFLIVSLEEILDKDPALMQLKEMDENKEANRDNNHSMWVISDLEV
jgi:hypothetical protein